MEYIFHTQFSDLEHLNGRTCKIIRQATEEDTPSWDIETMYIVEFNNGMTNLAYPDELTPKEV